MTPRHRSDSLHIRRPHEKRKNFVKNKNDKPKLPYSDHLASHYKRGYPPRPMVEPMHQGHWNTVDDYVDLGDRAPDKEDYE